MLVAEQSELGPRESPELVEDFDDYHVCHNDAWRMEHDAAWAHQHHPEWIGDYDTSTNGAT